RETSAAIWSVRAPGGPSTVCRCMRPPYAVEVTVRCRGTQGCKRAVAAALLERLGNERVADAAHREDDPRRRIVAFDQLAQPADVNVDRARLDVRVPTPHELPRAERLGDVVVGTQLESEYPIDLARPGRQHDERGPRRVGEGERALARVGLADGVALLDEMEANQLADVGLIVDDENGGARGHGRQPRDSTVPVLRGRCAGVKLSRRRAVPRR